MKKTEQLKIGDIVEYIQGGDGNFDRFGHVIRGEIISIVKKGSSMFYQLQKHKFKIKRHTTDISVRYDRALLYTENGYGTPFLQKLHKIGVDNDDNYE